MSNPQHVGNSTMETDLSTSQDGHDRLDPGCYTAEKLRHASANHVHLTNKRFFIGPIPKNWLQSHRKSWYKKRLDFRSYKSRAVTFSAESDHARESQPPQVARLPVAPEEDEPDTEQEQESSGPEDSQHTQHLRTLSHPFHADEDVPSPMPDATGSISNEEGYHRTSTLAKSAYFTAREESPTSASPGQASSARPVEQSSSRYLTVEQNERAPSISGQRSEQRVPSAPPSETGSTVPLLKDSQNKGKGKPHSVPHTNLRPQEPQRAISGQSQDFRFKRRDTKSPFSRIATRFSVNDNLHNRQRRVASRISKTQSMVPEWLSRRKVEEGEVVKAKKMLVRVEETIKEELPDDYSEFDSLRMETRVQDNWREFLVVCRSTSDQEAPFTLQMYKTRVVPKIQDPDRKASPYHEITLGRKVVKMNLYSSLDKTIAVWHKSKRGTKIYILRTSSTAHAVEWYTFIAYTLGGHRASSLAINVPDLAVSLIFNNPFKQLEAANSQGQQGVTAHSKCAIANQSAYLSVIRGCMKMLENQSEWSEVIKKWSNVDKMGLAWKRYDRLEWIHGPNEEEMYGSLAMQGTHELELRPKQHYGTSVGHGATREEEPVPIEGFLIRLTSQKGVHQRMNRIFTKRLYFFCQDQYLFFTQPSQALPPTPPILCRQESDIPSTQEILDETPLSYEIDPFPLQDGEISWLSNGNAEHLKQRDEEAYAQLHRNIYNLSNAEGFINLCTVQNVRLIPNDLNTDIQRNWETGASEPTNNAQEGNRCGESEDARFEIILDSGLVVRFQAYNRTTRDEWTNRLDALAKYWKARTAADAVELKDTRKRNLEILGIDEELESVIGQYAKKWEVKKAEASPLLHNMCSLLGCRSIKISGILHKKPRRHASFKRFHVVLTSGKLLVYHSSLRRRNGIEIPHIHDNLESSIDLENCYIYSGILTEGDLLYSNQTFDSNHPGHGALPRVYLASDLYTSSDEDSAITFVIWQPIRKNLFRAQELGEKGQTRQTLKQVSKLGAHGRTIVFKARSRVEKDRWVLSIASEIDRLQEGKTEDVRLTSP
ncbi:Pleckstrin homology domain-containing protein [Aspergillus californicus]